MLKSLTSSCDRYCHARTFEDIEASLTSGLDVHSPRSQYVHQHESVGLVAEASEEDAKEDDLALFSVASKVYEGEGSSVTVTLPYAFSLTLNVELLS